MIWQMKNIESERTQWVKKSLFAKKTYKSSMNLFSTSEIKYFHYSSYFYWLVMIFLVFFLTGILLSHQAKFQALSKVNSLFWMLSNSTWRPKSEVWNIMKQIKWKIIFLELNTVNKLWRWLRIDIAILKGSPLN